MKYRFEHCLVATLMAAILCAYASVAPAAESAQAPISANEAEQIAAKAISDLRAKKTELIEGEHGALYRIEDASATGGLRVILVDAQRARVVKIEEAGLARYTWPGVVAVGHRGSVSLAPENTLAAFKKAIEAGAILLEMDVRETKDRQLVIMHDMTIARTTTGTGGVKGLTAQELKAFDAGAKFDPAFAGEKIPTLEEVLDAIAGRALPDIDFKAGNPLLLVDLLKAKGLLGKVTLYCGDERLMRRTLAASPAFLIRPTIEGGVAELSAFLKKWDPPIVNMGLDPALVRAVHLAGKKAFINLMGPSDSAATAQAAIEAGADYIQTDHMDKLVPILKEQGCYATFDAVAGAK